jgi:hypothetical protein
MLNAPKRFRAAPREGNVLVHRQVEFAISRLSQVECILHGDFAAWCGEGLSNFTYVGVEGSVLSKEFAPHANFRASRRSGNTFAEPYAS